VLLHRRRPAVAPAEPRVTAAAARTVAPSPDMTFVVAGIGRQASALGKCAAEARAAQSSENRRRFFCVWSM
jgi:hypothetical protein